jgi:hypothetical protein
MQERITAEDPTVDIYEKSLALFHDMIDVILNESCCRFANKVFKAVKGFPTGLACGRTCAEIYLHMLERDLWTRFRYHMSFAWRYPCYRSGLTFFSTEIRVKTWVEFYKFGPEAMPARIRGLNVLALLVGTSKAVPLQMV